VVLVVDLDAAASPVKVAAAREQTLPDGVRRAVGENPCADRKRRQDGVVHAEARIDDSIAIDTEVLAIKSGLNVHFR
jgi:hypothetical protein